MRHGLPQSSVPVSSDRPSLQSGGTWFTPGGCFEYGETPEECAAREALEETGVTISSLHFLAVSNDFFPERQKHFITLWMPADYSGGDIGLRAPDESTQVNWFPHDQLPAPLFLCFANLTRGSANLHGHWFVR